MGVESKKQLTGAVKGSPLLRGVFFVVGQGVAFAGKRLGGAGGDREESSGFGKLLKITALMFSTNLVQNIPRFCQGRKRLQQSYHFIQDYLTKKNWDCLEVVPNFAGHGVHVRC